MRNVVCLWLVAVVFLVGCDKNKQNQEVLDVVPEHFYSTANAAKASKWMQAFPGPDKSVWVVQSERPLSGGPVKVEISRRSDRNELLESESLSFPANVDLFSIDSVNGKKPVLLLGEHFIPETPRGVLRLKVWKNGTTAVLMLPVFADANRHRSTQLLQDICFSTDRVYVWNGGEFHFYFRLSPKDESYNLTLNTCGYSRLFHYDSDGIRQWDRFLTPSRFEPDPEKTIWLLFPGEGPFDVDQNGDIFAASTVTNVKQGVQIAEEWGVTPPARGGQSTFALQTIDDTGKRKSGSFLVSSEFAVMTGTLVTPESLITLGSKFIVKPASTNDSTERDIWIREMDRATGALKHERVFDVEKEDIPLFLIPLKDGDFIAVAETGFDQVNTGSVVTSSDVSVMRLGADFSVKSRLRYGSPRADRVDECRLFDGDKLLFSGTWDGPITHTGEADRYDEGFWAWIPLFGW